MKLSRPGKGLRLAPRSTPRVPRIMVLPIALALSAGSMAACGPSSASTTPTSSAALTSTASPVATTSATARTVSAPANAGAVKVYLRRSGTGDKAFASVALPSKWTVTWRFDCQNLPKARGTFVLSSAKQGRARFNLTVQTGLGGGGQRPFTAAGRYSFAIKTSCGWDLTAATTPPAARK